jgi:hypothetical protein
VDNHGRSLKLEADGPAVVALGQQLTVRAAMDGAASIELMHHGRVLSRLERPEGVFAIDSASLGLGTAALVAVARLEAEGPVSAVSRPISIQVQRPPPLAPAGLPQRAKLSPGIAVAASGAAARIVKEARSAQWLEKLEVRPNAPITIEGYVNIATEDLYQFQWRSPRSVTLTINGEQLATSTVDRWHFVPVALRPGWHHVQVRIGGDGPPRVDLRFGGPGSYRVDARQFQAIEP